MRPEILFPLFAEISTLKGVGPRLAPALAHIAGPVVRDLAFLLPTGLIERRHARAGDIADGEQVIVEVRIDQHLPPPKIGIPWKVRASDDTGFVHLVWFKGGGSHLERLAPPGQVRIVAGRAERFNNQVQIAHPDYILAPARADEIVRIEPVYPAGQGLSARVVRRFVHEALSRVPDLPEWQDPLWLERQGWPGWKAALSEAHNPAGSSSLDPRSPPRARLAYDELLAHQLALQARRSERVGQSAPVITPSDTAARLEANLPFTLTRAQIDAIAEIRADLMSGQRMGRLLQGDVGSGKTIVAAVLMADAGESGFQAALMAPTEILARQHAERLLPLLEQVGVPGLLLTGRDTPARRRESQRRIHAGEVQVVIGTHALFQDDVSFSSLGLVIIDEQHRFGVSERQRLLAKGEGVHLLSMSATPIPRTLELTQFGDMEVSRLTEKPPGRQRIATAALPLERIGELTERLKSAAASGAQAYWICPLIDESETTDVAAAVARADHLRQVSGLRVGLAHGRMAGPDRDSVMQSFADGRLDVLVATTIVEVGVDVPRATIMVIEHAERFGLAQLHQLRGRVGRGSDRSACILLYGQLSDVARQRLDILRQSDDGFHIAEEDFRLRGGGDPLGLRQSGFPAYRFADPMVHRDLMLAASDDARLISQMGERLPAERRRALANLSALFDWRPERSDTD
jgi:ATP-dependent DNA helicase RecG